MCLYIVDQGGRVCTLLYIYLHGTSVFNATRKKNVDSRRTHFLQIGHSKDIYANCKYARNTYICAYGNILVILVPLCGHMVLKLYLKTE